MRDRAAVITGLRPESHGGATLDHETRGRCPDPRRAVARGKPPRCRNARSAAPRFREYVVAREKAELNAHAGKPDRPTACLCTGRKVMIAAQLGPRHAAPVVPHDERVGSRFERNHRCPGVQGIRDDLADDRFLERGGIGVPQVLEQVKQIDACFAHFRPASYVTSWRFVRHWSRKGRATLRLAALEGYPPQTGPSEERVAFRPRRSKGYRRATADSSRWSFVKSTGRPRHGWGETAAS